MSQLNHKAIFYIIVQQNYFNLYHFYWSKNVNLIVCWTNEWIQIYGAKSALSIQMIPYFWKWQFGKQVHTIIVHSISHKEAAKVCNIPNVHMQ